jgi:hypothetical protein
MAQEPPDDDDNYTETTGTTTLVEDYEYEFMEQHVLRGLRFMTNNLEGLPHDEQDIQDECEDEHEEQEEQEQEQEARPAQPDATFIAEKLIAQGVTFEMLVKCMMLEHEEYSDVREFERIDDDLFGKMRIIISNF